jgi:hypothetical protein
MNVAPGGSANQIAVITQGLGTNAFQKCKSKYSDERICIPLRHHFTFNPSRMPNRFDAIHFACGTIGDIH